MESDMKYFERIWINYMDILPIMPYEFFIYIEIINKIRENDFNFIGENKKIFIKLLELILDVIYRYKNYNDTDEEISKYDLEFACCFRIIQRLKNIN
jgi:hypothetical protein